VSELLSPEELEAELRAIGKARYHNNHPFHGLLHGGKLDKGQVQAWALNRYHYQSIIPMKDAAILARSSDSEFRRAWRQRIIDHDGTAEAPDGGIERWLGLTEALGLERDYVTSGRGLLPGTRFAVEAYLHFVSAKSLVEAVASSLTELFAPAIISDRVSGMLKNYSFVDAKALSYFDKRLYQAPRDANFALDYVKREARLPYQQQQVLKALEFKCDVLWSQLDALYYAYVAPGNIPPGAFRPDDRRSGA
jgi:coenzyme PQQ biosynthesis protein C